MLATVLPESKLTGAVANTYVLICCGLPLAELR